MKLRLFDTYQRQVRDFEPLNPGKVGLYACGPTVYNYAHIGNLRTYLFEDILRRVLELNDYEVHHVVNITDVGHLTSDADTGEDKMEQGARLAGRSAWELAAEYTEAFQVDLRLLNALEPHLWCRATDHIPEQIEAVKLIEKKGFAYSTADGVYFDTSKIADYGHLARLNIEGQQAGARVEVADKRNGTDFALWKFSPKDQQRQMEWDSPWGLGFPGWHIECTAMSAKYLGVFFDIHCGGEDHIPVHHTNEIAQSQACYHTQLANFWMHGYFLQTNQEKMSKSSGEFLRLQALIERGFDPLAYRYFCLNASYRAKLTFNWESLEGFANTLDRLRSLAHEWGPAGEVDADFVERFNSCVNDDLNTPRALGLTWELVKSDISDATKKATLLSFDRIFGLALADWQPPHKAEEAVPEEIQALAARRQQARAEKNWQEADSLRDQIQAAGYEIEDAPDGYEIRSRS